MSLKSEFVEICRVLKWKIATRHKRWPRSVEIPISKEPKKHVSNGVLITFINHATVLIQGNGVNIVSDPVFSDQIGPLPFIGPKRHKKAGISFDQFPKIDVVVISHNHYDHLDVRSLRQLVERDSPIVLVGVGNGKYFRKWKIEGAIEIDLWEEICLHGVSFTFTPAHHWSGRTLTDRNETRCGGFYIRFDKKTVYFAGDTGFGSVFESVRTKLGPPNVALLPIGAYEPRWFMRDCHMNPEDSVLACLELGASTCIAIHHSCFNLASEGMTDPLIELEEAKKVHGIAKNQFRVLEHGESVWI